MCPQPTAAAPLAGQLALFSRELVDLLKTSHGCRMPFSKFIPAYHHHFGRQCRSVGSCLIKRGGLDDWTFKYPTHLNTDNLKFGIWIVRIWKGQSTCTCHCTKPTIWKSNQYVILLDGAHFGPFLNGWLFGIRMAFKCPCKPLLFPQQ